ncbi:Glutaredoxin family protein [Striga hermonthica]|uniref:Glutaredoxin family protein n=1 Tax=Striga hermonthica TaxID=68872 RepID=A0A9N7MSW7_STRHE|nr:Glutaredoxin family protein [Striga hermonthica]
MKGVKGTLLKKLKTMKTIGYLKPERILQVNALVDGYFNHTSPQKSYTRPPFSDIQDQEEPKNVNFLVQLQEPEIIDVGELMKDLDYDDDDDDDDRETSIVSKNTDKENVRPPGDESSFRRPDPNSRTLFDPHLLAAFEQAVTDARAREVGRRSINVGVGAVEKKTFDLDPLAGFEERCPPGGGSLVILYTTSLRGIRKTFEECQRVRSLLENLRVSFVERDISMHAVFREELWGVLGERAVPPRVFVKGRYVGGAEEVLGLHEQGKLRALMLGIPTHEKLRGPCVGCVGFRFLVCLNCDGSRKVVPEGGRGSPDVCSECNENGVIVCPLCCC